MELPEVDPLPPREPWEEPPPTGWGSHLGGLGLETLAVLGAVAAAVSAWKLITLARHLSAEPVHSGWVWAELVILWGVCFLLGAAMVIVVWRRVGGLALLGAMLTDHGRVARFGGRPPIWLDEPPPVGVRLAHLSDLHLTEGEKVRMVERARPGGNRAFAALLTRPELARADAVVITGDVTDRGTAKSWQRTRALIEAAGIADHVILVPGNHDLSLIDPWGGWRDPAGHWRRNDRFGVVQLANLIKFFESFAATAGGRRGSVLSAGQLVPYREAWAAAEAEVRPMIDDLPNQPVPNRRPGEGFFSRLRQHRQYARRIAGARKRLLHLFPIAVPLREAAPGMEGHEAVLFVLNSCTPVARHPATNALGRVGRAQYRRLDKLAGLCPQPIKLLALHHHVVRRVEEQAHDLRSRIVAKFTVLGDAPPLVRFCRKHDVRAVLNGHRHLSYQLRLPNGTVLMAAPSSTIGDELAHDPRPQFDHYDIAPTADHPTVGIYRRVVRLPPLG
jgi:3',5'-cyclic AMP phosphodiesterase CpdA